MNTKTLLLIFCLITVFFQDGFGQGSDHAELDRLLERENMLLLEENVRERQQERDAESQIPGLVNFEELFDSVLWSISKNDRLCDYLNCDAKDCRDISKIEKKFRERIESLDSGSLQNNVEYGFRLAEFRERMIVFLGPDRSRRAGVLAAKLACDESAPDFLSVLAIMKFLGPTDERLSTLTKNCWSEYQQSLVTEEELGVREIKELLPRTARARFDAILAVSLNANLEGSNSKSTLKSIQKKLIEALFFENEFSENVDLVSFQTAGLEQLLRRINQNEEFQTVSRIVLELEKTGRADESTLLRELQLRRESISSRMLESFVVDIKNELVPHQCEFFENASLYYFAKSRNELPFVWPLILEMHLELDGLALESVQKKADSLMKDMSATKGRLSSGFLRAIRLAASPDLRKKLGDLDIVLKNKITRKDLTGEIPKLNTRAKKRSLFIN